MPNTLHAFLTDAIPKAAAELEAAYRHLPEGKRHWSPGGNARTAADMVAECAILNDTTAVLAARSFPADFDYAQFQQAKCALALDEAAMLVRLHESASQGVSALQAVPEGDLGVKIPTPWADYTVAGFMAYPYWNMSYHLGQINYIASLLDGEV